MIHDVTVSLPGHSLGNVPFEFKVEEGGELLGTLIVSKGAPSWRPRNKKNPIKYTWTRFQELMESPKLRN